MTSSKRAKIEYDDLPLDLSLKKVPEKMAEDEYDDEDDEEVEEEEVEVERDKSLVKISPLDESGVFIVPAVPPLSHPILKIPEKLLSLEWLLTEELRCIQFQLPVEYVYNPIEYAFDVHAKYVRKYCQTTKKILFLGMNPGPWGMTQTGVPFGEVKMVRDWLGLSGCIGKPVREQPDRKVTGFACTRSEISGRRFWGLFKDVCQTPENFFRHSYLHNYCPIALMDTKGRNITPAELKGLEQKTLYYRCDEALVATIKLLRIEIVIGVGRFAEKRAQTVVKTAGLPTQVLCIPHPSPRSLGNENWSEKAAQRLQELNLLRYFAK
ncbi:single-strand selective monofunctional uracil DNA glycosylase [Neodiprion pinetum]|uniref:single-strand selective monofunctional uracil DNA glycosylase n=1 Tax=Neodiprion pinetum TaxID=441929 RepID=UPI001EDE4D4E|nr:single-strand selective monofunctional uracil DNA glycosylase [Neodiprion pinetum]